MKLEGRRPAKHDTEPKGDKKKELASKLLHILTTLYAVSLFVNQLPTNEIQDIKNLILPGLFSIITLLLTLDKFSPEIGDLWNKAISRFDTPQPPAITKNWVSFTGETGASPGDETPVVLSAENSAVIDQTIADLAINDNIITRLFDWLKVDLASQCVVTPEKRGVGALAQVASDKLAADSTKSRNLIIASLPPLFADFVTVSAQPKLNIQKVAVEGESLNICEIAKELTISTQTVMIRPADGFGEGEKSCSLALLLWQEEKELKLKPKTDASSQGQAIIDAFNTGDRSKYPVETNLIRTFKAAIEQPTQTVMVADIRSDKEAAYFLATPVLEVTKDGWGDVSIKIKYTLGEKQVATGKDIRLITAIAQLKSIGSVGKAKDKATQVIIFKPDWQDPKELWEKLIKEGPNKDYLASRYFINDQWS